MRRIEKPFFLAFCLARYISSIASTCPVLRTPKKRRRAPHITGTTPHIVTKAPYTMGKPPSIKNLEPVMKLSAKRCFPCSKGKNGYLRNSCARRFLLSVRMISYRLRKLPRCSAARVILVSVHYVSRMVKEGLLELRYPENISHPHQAYRSRK